MTYYIAQAQSCDFNPKEQPEGFRLISAIENRCFICESPTQPNSPFVVEFPDRLFGNMQYFNFPNGKKLWFDPFNGAVKFGDEVDSKNRRKIEYSPEQIGIRLELYQWFMTNVWIPDMVRLFSTPEEVKQRLLKEVSELTTDDDAVLYLKMNLHYNL